MRCRRIGVSASGYGGTNSHAILESIDSVAPGYRRHVSMFDVAKQSINGVSREKPTTISRPHLLLFSAHDTPTLKNNLARYASHCRVANPLDLAFTLGVHRTKFPHRTFAICHEDTIEATITAAAADIIPAPAEAAMPAFVFTGN